MSTATILLVGALLAAPGGEKPDFKALVGQLSERATSQAALEALVAQKAAAIPWLTGAAVESSDLTTRGWAIVGLTQVGGEGPKKTLVTLSEDTKAPPLVRTWAYSARVQLAATLEELLPLAQLMNQYPALKRPISLKLPQLAGAAASGEALLTLAASNYQLQQLLVEPILGLGQDKLVLAMLTAKDQRARQTAAAYLGTLAQRMGKAGNETVGLAVAKALAYDKKAQAAPWAGGPLYVPNIGWDKQMGTALMEALVSWHVHCDVTGQTEELSKINHSLNSRALAGPVGYQVDFQAHDTAFWLGAWRQVKGEAGVRALLKKTGGAERFGSR